MVLSFCRFSLTQFLFFHYSFGMSSFSVPLSSLHIQWWMNCETKSRRKGFQIVLFERDESKCTFICHLGKHLQVKYCVRSSFSFSTSFFFFSSLFPLTRSFVLFEGPRKENFRKKEFKERKKIYKQVNKRSTWG